MRWTVLCLAALLVTAGCLGGQDEDLEPTQQPPEDPEPPTNGTAEATVSSETYQGTITGANVVVASVNTGDSDTVVTFQVADEAQKLGLFVTGEDGATLSVLIGQPGCEANSGCEEEITADPHAEWNATGPEPGEWRLRVFHGEPGAGQVGYTVEVKTLLPAGQGAGGDA